MTICNFAITKFHFKICLLLAVLLCAFEFEGCTADDSLIEEPERNEEIFNDITINFNLYIDRGITTTRSGRQLWSRDPKQQVNDLRLYVFEGADENATYVKTIDVKEFANNSPADTQTEKVSIKGVLETGKTYSFLAVGFESDTEQIVKEVPSEEDPEKTVLVTESRVKENDTYILTNIAEGTTLSSVTLSLMEDRRADEVFSGIKTGIKLYEGTKVVYGGEIRLYRVTAGVLGYFEHIPYQLPDKDNVMRKVSRMSLVVADEGRATSLISPYAPESQSGKEYELFTFSFAGLSQDGANNWYSIPSYDWSAEGLEKAPSGVKKMKDSVLAGAFLLPFNNTGKEETMRLMLYGEGDELLRTYSVMCSDHVSNTGDDSIVNHDNKKIFDIKGNHYYCLGIKYTDSGDEPDDPTEPFQPDDPIDLSKEQIITITVNPGWDQRHDLTL